MKNGWACATVGPDIIPLCTYCHLRQLQNRIEELIGIANEQTKEFENPLLEDNQKVLLKLNDEIFKEIFQLLERYFLPYIYRTDSTQYA